MQSERDWLLVLSDAVHSWSTLFQSCCGRRLSQETIERRRSRFFIQRHHPPLIGSLKPVAADEIPSNYVKHGWLILLCAIASYDLIVLLCLILTWASFRYSVQPSQPISNSKSTAPDNSVGLSRSPIQRALIAHYAVPLLVLLTLFNLGDGAINRSACASRRFLE